MLYKLAARSFAKQLKHYVVYFFSLTIIAMIFYSFQTMTKDQPLIKLASQDISIDGVLTAANFTISIILFFFMFSVNRFFLEQRMRETALYQLFGAKKIQIIFIYLIETATLGICALIPGIGLGIVFSKLFSMVLIKAMDLKFASEFFISVQSIIQTAVVFFGLLFLIFCYSAWKIARTSVGHSFEKENDELSRQMVLRIRDKILGSAGLVLLLISFLLAFRFRLISTWLIQLDSTGLMVLLLPLVIFFMCIVGTHLFYAYSIRIIFHYLGNARKTYSNLKVLMIGNTKVHYLKGRRTFTMITCTLGIALACIGASISMSSAFMKLEKIANPTSFLVADNQLSDIRKILEQHDVEVTQQLPVQLKLVGSTIPTSSKNQNNSFELRDIISVSQFNQLNKLNPQVPKVKIENKNEVILLDEIASILRSFNNVRTKINLPDDTTVQIVKQLPDFLGNNWMRYSATTLIVDDDLFAQVAGYEYRLVYLNAKDMNQEAVSEDLLNNLSSNWQDRVGYDYQISKNSIKGQIGPTVTIDEEDRGETNTYTGEVHKLSYMEKFTRMRSIRRQTAIFIYVMIFLGIIAVFVCGSILVVRLLAEADREKGNYLLLKKLGMPIKLIRKTIYIQNAWIFFPPLGIGILQALFVISVFKQFIKSPGYMIAYIVCGMMVLLFTIFYVVTSKLYCRVIKV